MQNYKRMETIKRKKDIRLTGADAFFIFSINNEFVCS